MYVGSNLKWDSDSTWFHLNLNCQFLASREILVPNGSSKKHLKIGATNLVCGGYPILIHVWHFRKVRQLEPEYYVYIYILSVWTSIQYMKQCIKSSLYVKYDTANLPNLYPLFYRDHGRRVKTCHHAPFVQQFQVPVEGSTCATMTRVRR